MEVEKHQHSEKGEVLPSSPIFYLTTSESNHLSNCLPKGFAIKRDLPLQKSKELELLSKNFEPIDRKREHRSAIIDGESWAQHAIQVLLKLENTGAGSRLAQFQTRMSLLTDKKNKVPTTMDLLAIRKKLQKGDYIGPKSFLKEVTEVWRSIESLAADDPLSDYTLAEDLRDNFEEIFKNPNPSSVDIDPLPMLHAAAEEPMLAKRKSSLTLSMKRKPSSQQLVNKPPPKRPVVAPTQWTQRNPMRLEREGPTDKYLRSMPTEDQLVVWDILTKHNPSLKEQDQVLMNVSELSDQAIDELWVLVSKRLNIPAPHVPPPRPVSTVTVTPTAGVLGVNGNGISGGLFGLPPNKVSSFGPKPASAAPKTSNTLSIGLKPPVASKQDKPSSHSSFVTSSEDESD